MVLLVREFVRTCEPLIHDPLNTYTHAEAIHNVGPVVSTRGEARFLSHYSL